MTFQFKGFATHALFANNAPGATSVMGEISTQSLTYARETGLYNSSIDIDIGIISFTSKKDNVKFQPTSQIVDHVTLIIKHIYDHAISVRSVIYADELLNDLLDTYVGKADNFESGAIVNNGTYYIPEWISWRNLDNPDISDNTIKIWFSDDSFQKQYDEFEIVIIPPVDNLDDFFKTGTQVDAMMAAISPIDTMNKIQAAKGKYPETVIRTETFNYIDPNNQSHIVPTVWNVLIYGIAGDNIDSVIDAIDSYVLANSTRTRPDWIAIIPTLFRRTEFIVMPLWDQYAIPNRTLQAGIYSPITNPTTSVNKLVKIVPSYPAAHIRSNVSIFSNPYKSLSILAVGGPENINNQYILSAVFSDYINIGSTSIDFNRMTQLTQDWALMLEHMLIIAESMNEFTTVPINMTKMVRDGILYLVQRYNNIHYLVVAKKNFPISGV